MECVALQDLNSLPLAVQDVADGGILVSVVVRAQHGEALHGIGCALHQLVDADPGGSDGQQAHSGENGVPAAHIVRNHEGGPALRVSQLLQGAFGTVRGGIDALVGFLNTHLILQQLAQNTERQAGLGGGTGLGDDIDGELLALVVVQALDSLDHSAGTQIAAADAGNHQHLGVLTDLLGSFLDAGKLFLVVIAGQVHPAQEIIAGTILGFQLVVSRFHLRINGLIFLFVDKTGEVLCIQNDAHSIRTSKRFYGTCSLRVLLV